MLRRLADDGKTVICITHNLGNVVECAHSIVVMANGGFLAFVGIPVETLAYFAISDLRQLYLRLMDRTAPQWAAAFARTKRFADIAVSADKRSLHSDRPEIRRAPVTPLQHLGVCVRHSITTGKRNVALQLSDKRSLLVAAIQPVLVAFLIVILFGTISGLLTAMYSQQVLFLLGITAFWLGCNNAAKEIVKERSLFEKERNAGLDAVGYLMSKFVLLSLFTAVQSTLLLWIVAIGTGLQGSMIVYSVKFISGRCVRRVSWTSHISGGVKF